MLPIHWTKRFGQSIKHFRQMARKTYKKVNRPSTKCVHTWLWCTCFFFSLWLCLLLSIILKCKQIFIYCHRDFLFTQNRKWIVWIWLKLPASGCISKKSKPLMYVDIYRISFSKQRIMCINTCCQVIRYFSHIWEKFVKSSDLKWMIQKNHLKSCPGVIKMNGMTNNLVIFQNSSDEKKLFISKINQISPNKIDKKTYCSF